MRNMNEVLLVAIAMAGCATSAEVRIPEQLAHRPQAYREAYVDGCKSGQAKGTQLLDAERIKTDSLYANGWYDGYEECKSNQRQSIRDGVRDAQIKK